MAKAIVDPGEVRRFANDLKRFNNEVQGQMTILQSRFRALCQSWRDQENRKFAEELDQTMRVLTRFTKATDDHIPFLLRKASRADDYLQQR